MQMSRSAPPPTAVTVPRTTASTIPTSEPHAFTVPASAIYVQNGRKGIVIETEGGEYWTGVEVTSISDDGMYAYVVPDKPEVVYEGVMVRLF